MNGPQRNGLTAPGLVVEVQQNKENSHSETVVSLTYMMSDFPPFFRKAVPAIRLQKKSRQQDGS